MCGVTDIGIFIVAVINFISAVTPNHTEKKKINKIPRKI